MIINFSLENWMSFRDKVEFSMVASRERQHGDRLPRVGKYRMRLLPVAAIYGGNASGKTNFFKALGFAKRFVAEGTQPDRPIPVEPFRLGATDDKPSRFDFELLIDETIYQFSFAVTRKAVLEEKLAVVKSTSEKVLYHRRDGKPNFDSSLAEDGFLKFAFEGTRDNQLFLTCAATQRVTAATKKVDKLRPVYNWFRDTLELIAPDSRFAPSEQFLNEEHPYHRPLNEMLEQLDTGIERLGGEEIPFKDIPLPEALKTGLPEVVEEGRSLPMAGYRVARKGGELTARKLVTYRLKADDTEVKFDLDQESAGTQRLLNLLPAFLALLFQRKKVYVIDELDRSLHPLLTRRLLREHLDACSAQTRSQLLLTTHDAVLIDQNLLRRDEIWVTERNLYGASTLFSFRQYEDMRHDSDLRKSYLQGRLGGIPQLLWWIIPPPPKQGQEDTDAA